MKTLKELNARNREVYDCPGPRLVAQLPASRYVVELMEGLHRIYDTLPTEREGVDLPGGLTDSIDHPLSGLNDSESDPLNAAEQEQKDRASVTDAAQSMPQRLRALGRLNAQRYRGK
jgi:hypothetical protein